jgi:hypothetical protein
MMCGRGDTVLTCAGVVVRQVISKLIEQGRAEKLVVQVSDARETKLGATVPSINATLAKLAQGERA